MCIISNENGTASVVDKNNQIIDTFESCGCIYRDLGMCQGCPVCRFADEDEE